MTYATEDGMVERFGTKEMTELKHAGINYDQAFIDTDGLINGYLARSYQVPLQNPTTTLVGIACDIARYKIRSRMNMGAEAVNDDVRRRYEDALKFLKDAEDGKLVIALDNTPTSEGNASTHFSSRSNRSIFTPKKGLRGWILDC